MRFLTVKIFLTLALIGGANVASYAGDQEVRRIPQGRGQFIEAWTGRAAKSIKALFKKGGNHPTIVQVNTSDAKLHPVTKTKVLTGRVRSTTDQNDPNGSLYLGGGPLYYESQNLNWEQAPPFGTW